MNVQTQVHKLNEEQLSGVHRKTKFDPQSELLQGGVTDTCDSTKSFGTCNIFNYRLNLYFISFPLVPLMINPLTRYFSLLMMHQTQYESP